LWRNENEKKEKRKRERNGKEHGMERKRKDRKGRKKVKRVFLTMFAGLYEGGRKEEEEGKGLGRFQK